MHICTHMHAWNHMEFPGIPLMGVAICMKFSCLPHMHVCVCMHSCMCMCTCVGGTPTPSTHSHPDPPILIHPPPSTHPHPHQPTLHPIHPPLHPKSCREPKTPKFNKSWTNQDNLIVWRFFTSEHFWTHIDYSWSPWIPTHPPALPPPPQSWGNPNQKNYNNSWTNWDNSIVWRFVTLEPSCTHID